MKDSALDRLEAMGFVTHRFDEKVSAKIEADYQVVPFQFKVLAEIDPCKGLQPEEDCNWNSPGGWYDHVLRLETDNGQQLLRYQRRFYGDLMEDKPPVWAVWAI